MGYEFVLVDVFTEHVFGGNQLAVLPEAQGLTAGQMQAIAREFNFAETAFVLPAEGPGATRRLRIFSPGAEMPFAGHPTVGAAAALVRIGAIPAPDGRARLTFEEAVGPVQVTVSADGDRLHAELLLAGALAQPRDQPDANGLAHALGLSPDVVRGAWFASVGLPFCFCQLAGAADVDRAVLDKPAWAAALGEAWAQHLFFFAGDLADGGELYARMFAPSIGVDEDPATGSASATLAGWLAHKTGQSVAFTIKQGFAMNRPSIISAGALVEGGRLRHVTVGGQVAVFARGTLAAVGADARTGPES
ncbi:MAG TPA: PhzF family phenazine biosynthesis protein [Mycobacteriales bacterium]|nr:PhzF family phenazine biosynthesis protein [Mycobacteriales bacterium]